MFIGVTVSLGPSGLEVTDRQPLFLAPRLIRESRQQYQVLDDGERFIFNEIAETVPRRMTYIDNWLSLVN